MIFSKNISWAHNNYNGIFCRIDVTAEMEDFLVDLQRTMPIVAFLLPVLSPKFYHSDLQILENNNRKYKLSELKQLLR